MYYDARVGTNWNGLFDFLSLEPGKTYHPYMAFHRMSLLKNEVYLACEHNDVYAIAAADGNQTQLLLTYYSEDDNSPNGEIELKFHSECEGELRCYRTDQTNNEELIQASHVTIGEQSVKIPLNLFDICHIVIDGV